MKILLTGGSGFIGSRLAFLLHRHGHEVHVVTRAARAELSAELHVADVMDANAMRDIVAKVRPEVLVHLAWITTPGVFWNSPENLRWLAASSCLMKDAVELGCSAIVAAGTCAEYVLDGRVSVEDETPTANRTLYAATKNALRMVGTSYAESTGSRFAWGRIFYPYGSGESSEKFLSLVVRALERGAVFEVREPTRRIDYVHADDVAAAFAALVESPAAAGTFNIASGRAESLLGLAREVAEAMDVDASRVRAMPNPQEGPNIIGRIDRLGALGWLPVRTLKTGLAELLSTRGGMH